MLYFYGLYNSERSKFLSPDRCAEALVLCMQLLEESEGFKASIGLLNRHLNVFGEKLLADTSVFNSYNKEVRQQIQDGEYTAKQIYNYDETGLNCKMLPTTPLASRAQTKQRKSDNLNM